MTDRPLTARENVIRGQPRGPHGVVQPRGTLMTKSRFAPSPIFPQRAAPQAEADAIVAEVARTNPRLLSLIRAAIDRRLPRAADLPAEAAPLPAVPRSTPTPSSANADDGDPAEDDLED